MINPNLRYLTMALILESLKQHRFSGAGEWATWSTLCADVEASLPSHGYDSDRVQREGAKSTMSLVSSAANELEERSLLETTRESGRYQIKKGVFGIGDRYQEFTVLYYSLTPKGREAARLLNWPDASSTRNQPMSVRLNGNTFVFGSANFYYEITSFVNSDADAQAILDAVRDMKEDAALRARVGELVAENHRLQDKLESRGWKVAEFAARIAALVLG